MCEQMLNNIYFLKTRIMEEKDFTTELTVQEKNAKEIEQMVEEHEKYKLKWYKLNDEDIRNRTALQERMLDKSLELKSLYMEEKNQCDTDKGIRLLELKAILDENWKKKYTDSTADWVIKQEFKQRETDISIHKLQGELLFQKASAIERYVNLIKLYMKKDFTS